MKRNDLDDVSVMHGSRRRKKRAMFGSSQSAPLDFAPALASSRSGAGTGPTRRRRPGMWLTVLVGLGIAAAALWQSGSVDIVEKVRGLSILQPAKPVEPPAPPPVTALQIADALTGPISQNIYPTHIKLTRGTAVVDGKVEYALDPTLQRTAENIFERYKPDYGAFVAVDPASGRVLAMTSFTKVDPTLGNLALHASFPAASVFKIVTAAAGIDQGTLTPGTIIPFNGKSTALYKKHVLRHKDNKWTRRPTLREAFAKSINPVFGRLGVFDVGANVLTSYAEQFGFNKAIGFDLELPSSAMTVIEGDEWSVAEAASGYTSRNTLSPIHGAMMAAAIVNEGIMMEPRLVTAVRNDTGNVIYEPTWSVAGQPISSTTASDMRELMQATVKRGSARKPFRGFFKGQYKDVEVGGKTGSLTGSNPKGRNDWFVGYAVRGERRIAFAALTVNVEKWTVKSGRVARIAIESWFDTPKQVSTVQ